MTHKGDNENVQLIEKRGTVPRNVVRKQRIVAAEEIGPGGFFIFNNFSLLFLSFILLLVHRLEGPRHNNDSEDYRKIAIIPTKEEIFCEISP